jgi:DNA-binding response OmpR family regulator
MNIKNNIAVFNDDECFLAMMKGYCYANNIFLTEIVFTLQGINGLENQNYDLIIIPLDWLTDLDKGFETDLIRKIALKSQLRICALKRNYTEAISTDCSEWVDVMISNSQDIAEIDAYLTKALCLKSSITERRGNGDRRFYKDRRNHNKNGEDKIIVNAGFQREAEKKENKDFKLDHISKCLFLSGQRISLTPKEFELIELLLTDVDRVFTTEEIITHLWPESDRATKADLYQYMHLLRRKIEKDPLNPIWILTVKGFGYKLSLGDTQVAQWTYPDFTKIDKCYFPTIISHFVYS